jgi:DNA-binding LytR/AlgR family response regulator
MKAILVDDEAPARRRLARMLEEFAGVEVIAQLEDGEAVVDALTQCVPDVLFLDVRMPGLDGLTLVQRAQALPPVVFVTAHDCHAVDAFAADAVDYLLKPVRPERLIATVDRVRSRAEQRRAQSAAEERLPLRLVTSTRGTIRCFDAREVTRFWASEKYTLFRARGAEQISEEPLSVLEQRLSGHGFVRVHRAELVRVDAVQALRVAEGGHEVVLSDGQVARVSRRALQAMKQALGLGSLPDP